MCGASRSAHELSLTHTHSINAHRPSTHTRGTQKTCACTHTQTHIHTHSFEQNCAHCSWSHSEPKLLSLSSVRSFMCLSAFPCTSISCNSSRMHALCAAVTTSFCPRHPALWIWPIVSFGSTPFQLPPFSSYAFLHNIHSAFSL